MASPSVYETYAEIIGLARQPFSVAAADWLAVAPIATGLIAAAVLVIVARKERLQSALALGALGLMLLFEALLLVRVLEAGPVVMTLSGWRPPFGIAFAVDALGASFGLVSALVALACGIYGLADGSRGERLFGFYPFLVTLLTGVLGAFHTGDLFNLYVWFEVLLIASFGLIVLGGRPGQLDGALRYCILNFLATTVFLIATGLLYGSVGTLNMADIAIALQTPPDGMPVATIGMLFLFGFGMKAAAFPLNAWLPASYHTPRTVVSALFAGLLTKVGVYALIRTVGTLYPAMPPGMLDLLVVSGAATAVLAALGALGQADIRRMGSYIVVSGIGLMLIGIGLASRIGYEGAVAYAMHSILTMTALFLLIGIVVTWGPSRLSEAGGLYKRSPLLAAAFLAVAFSTAGLPPFSGFWPKAALVQASLEGGAWYATLAVLVSGLVTTIALGRLFAFAFWRDGPASEIAQADMRLTRSLTAPTYALAVLVVVVGLWPRLIFDPAALSAAQLLDPATYIQAVFPDGVPGREVLP